MYLIQRLTEQNYKDVFKIIDRQYPTMKALIKDMKENPKSFNESMEYSLIELKPFLQLKYKQQAAIEIIDNFVNTSKTVGEGEQPDV